MLWPDRWPPTFGSGPACCSASPRVPPGGSTTRVAQLRERKEIPAVQRQLHDLAVLDDVADLRVGTQQRELAGHEHFLGDAARFELEIDRECLPQLERNARTNGSPESGELRRKAVPARANRREEIAALIIGDALDPRPAVQVLCHNDHAGQHTALRVADDAGNFTGVGLRHRYGRGGHDGNQRDSDC